MKTARFFALLALPLMAATALPAQNVTVTGNNGGTLNRDRDCTRTSGTANCSRSSTLTTPAGETATWGRDRTRVTGDGASTGTVTTTGPGGETRSRTRLITN